jgi:hypothetical protein
VLFGASGEFKFIALGRFGVDRQPKCKVRSMVKPENLIEKYKFLRLYDMDFECVLQTIKILKRYRKKDVRYALLRDIVVTYCRPFTESKGFKIGKDFCGVKFEDKNMKQLHKELLSLRKEIFAHTDLKYKNPKVVNWSTESYKWFPMSFKGFDYDAVDNKLPEIIRLVNYVRKQNQDNIAKYEKNF